VQVAWDTPLESSRRELKLCFRPHLGRRPKREVIAPQSCESPNFSSFEIPFWESQDKKPLGCSLCGATPWRSAEYTIWGKVVVSPEPRLWWVLWVQSRPWLVLAPKVLKHSTNQRVGWFDTYPNE
jgi:hypothetical protein